MWRVKLVVAVLAAAFAGGGWVVAYARGKKIDAVEAKLAMNQRELARCTDSRVSLEEAIAEQNRAIAEIAERYRDVIVRLQRQREEITRAAEEYKRDAEAAAERLRRLQDRVSELEPGEACRESIEWLTGELRRLR